MQRRAADNEAERAARQKKQRRRRSAITLDNEGNPVGMGSASSGNGSAIGPGQPGSITPQQQKGVQRKRRLVAMAYLSFGLNLAISVYWLDVPISRFGGLPHIVSLLAIITIALITGTYLAVGFVAARWVANLWSWPMRWVLPFFWLSTDYVRGAWIHGYPFSGFPWAHLSATQVEHPLTRQLAAIAGIDGIGLWLFALNAYSVFADFPVISQKANSIRSQFPFAIHRN